MQNWGGEGVDKALGMEKGRWGIKGGEEGRKGRLRGRERQFATQKWNRGRLGMGRGRERLELGMKGIR